MIHKSQRAAFKARAWLHLYEGGGRTFVEFMSPLEIWDDQLTPVDGQSRSSSDWAQEILEHWRPKDWEDHFNLQTEDELFVEVIFDGECFGEWSTTYDGDEWDEWIDVKDGWRTQTLPKEWFDDEEGVSGEAVG